MSKLEHDAAFYANLANLISANIDDKNKGQTFLGDGTKYANIELEYFAGEMAFLFICQIIFFNAMLGKLNGRFLRMRQWIHFQDYEVLGNTVKSQGLVTYMSIVGYFYIVTPFLTLLLWFAFMIKDAGSNNREYTHKNPVFVGAISILLLGSFAILSVTAVNKITWNNYRFKPINLLVFLFAYLLFTAWQFMITFASTYEDYNFQGVSMVFLTQSFVVMCIIVYLNLYENKFNLIYFLTRFMKEGDETPDPTRNNNMLDEIEEQKANDDWMPTMKELFDMLTIGKISEKKMMNAFGQGFQRMAMEQSPMIRKIVNIGLLVLYLGILAVYSYLDYDFNHGSKLGLVSSIAVVINDIYVYLMYNSRIINRISVLALIMFCSRIFILIGGADYWVYGYLFIYVWLECIIALGIVKKRLPLNSELLTMSENAMAAKKTKFLDLAHVPEFIFMVITIGLVCSIVVATAVEPKGVYLRDLPISSGIEYQSAVGLAILVVFSFLFAMSWVRAFKRKISRTVGDTYVFLCAKRIDTYYIVCLICYICTVFWTLGFYAFIKDKIILITGFILPAIMFFFFNIVIVYIINNFYFVEDVNGINRNIKAHNKRVDLLREKANKLKKIMQDPDKGPEAIYGLEHGRIVQKVMDIEVARRQADKLSKDFGGKEAAEDQSGQTFKRIQTGAFGRSVTLKKKIKAANKGNTVQASPSPSSATEKVQDFDDSALQGGAASANPEQVLLDNGNQSEASPDRKAMFNNTMTKLKLDDDSSEEDVANIPTHLLPFRKTRIDKKKKLLVTWSDQGYGFMQAFFQGKLRPNDYTMLWSCIFLVSFIIIYGALAAAYTVDSIGLVFAFVVLHVVLLAISMLGNIVANRQNDTWERILQVVSFIIIYVVGIVYLFIAYDATLLSKDNDDLNVEERAEKELAQSFVSTELIVIPFITAFIAFCAKAYRDNKNGRSMTTGFWVLLILNFIHGIALTVVFFAYLSSTSAWIALFVLIFFFYDFVQYIVRVRYTTNVLKVSDKISITPYQIGGIFNAINLILSVGIMIAAVVWAGQQDDIALFATASFVIWILLVLLTFATLARWVADRSRMNGMPIYYSPWIFPIYKYYPDANDVEPYSSAVVAFYFISAIVWFWCIWVSVEISPSWLGAFLSCLLEGVIMVVTLYFLNTNNLQYQKIKPYVDQLVIKQAWLSAKENLVKMLQIDSRADYVSYEMWWRRRFMLRNYLKFWNSNSVHSWPELEEFEDQKQEYENAANKGEFLRSKVESWVDEDEVDLDSWEDCQKFLYDVDKETRKAYMAELETIIQFQLIILQNAKLLAVEEQCYLFQFIKAKRPELFLVGINFELSQADSAQVRYTAAMTEIRKLTPDKQTLFNSLKDQYIEEERQKQILIELKAAQEERKSLERLEALAAMSGKRKAAMEEMLRNPDMPLDDMPDCYVKLEKLRQDCKDNTRKYTDKQFDHEQEEQVFGTAIFEDKRGRAIHGWKRASDIPGAVLFRDGASHEDITQGALGDCYFLSALSVLGNDRTVDLFACQKDSDQENEADPNHWKKTGAFMLTFHKNGEFQYIIVDDWLPMCNDSPAFTKGGPDGLEMWPAILEKAYAKLYGSYAAIEAGKVHLALADMVENGFPEQLALKPLVNNVKQFATKMRNFDKVKALMGAGSPENERGDSAISDEGIVQGHAYAILDVADYMSQQLLMLRNPHGRADYTKEWTGDWADDSEQWNAKAKAELKYTPNDEVDGIFWMCNSDFLSQFKYVYVCRELTEKKGWYVKDISSAWKGPSSAGFPGKLRQVPQFKLTIHAPCSGYIALTQMDDSGSSFKGKNLVGWMVSREQGRIMAKLSKRNLITKAGISDLKTLSSEIEFDEKVSYPYTFTIICGSLKAGPSGEGNFELKVYTRDPKMKLDKLNHNE